MPRMDHDLRDMRDAGQTLVALMNRRHTRRLNDLMETYITEEFTKVRAAGGQLEKKRIVRDAYNHAHTTLYGMAPELEADEGPPALP